MIFYQQKKINQLVVPKNTENYILYSYLETSRLDNKWSYLNRFSFKFIGSVTLHNYEEKTFLSKIVFLSFYCKWIDCPAETMYFGVWTYKTLVNLLGGQIGFFFLSWIFSPFFNVRIGWLLRCVGGVPFWIWEHHRVPGGTIIYTQLGCCNILFSCFGNDNFLF